MFLFSGVERHDFSCGGKSNINPSLSLFFEVSCLFSHTAGLWCVCCEEHMFSERLYLTGSVRGLMNIDRLN